MLIVYGIKTCDSCRKALKWLREQGREHQFRDLRAAGIAPERVASWVDSLGSKALRNTSGGSYRSLPADKDDWPEARWKAALATDPMLIKRPVLERDGTALAAGFRGWESLL